MQIKVGKSLDELHISLSREEVRALRLKLGGRKVDDIKYLSGEERNPYSEEDKSFLLKFNETTSIFRDDPQKLLDDDELELIRTAQAKIYQDLFDWLLNLEADIHRMEMSIEGKNLDEKFVKKFSQVRKAACNAFVFLMDEEYVPDFVDEEDLRLLEPQNR